MAVPPSPSVGGARPHVASIDCEPCRDGRIAQRANTASSLVYLLAGWWVHRSAPPDDPGGPVGRIALPMALGAVGIGSVGFHGPGGTAGKRAHDWSIVLLAAALAPRLRAAVRRPPPPMATAALVTASAASIVLHHRSQTGGAWCDPDATIGGHAWWHVASATVLVGWIAATRPSPSGATGGPA